MLDWDSLTLLLFRHRNCSYGPSAWWWEAEELVRKLLLTAVAVLLDAGSPLQVPGDAQLPCCCEPSDINLNELTELPLCSWLLAGDPGGGNLQRSPRVACGVQAVGPGYSNVRGDAYLSRKPSCGDAGEASVFNVPDIAS